MRDHSMTGRLDIETRQRLQDIVRGGSRSANAAIVDAINKRREALHATAPHPAAIAVEDLDAACWPVRAGETCIECEQCRLERLRNCDVKRIPATHRIA